MSDALLLLLVTILLIVSIDTRRQLYRTTTKHKKSGELILDTSALIDARIVDIARSGFLGDSRYVIPKVVLRELQQLADGRDTHKRERARVGLESAAELQTLFGKKCVIDDYGMSSKDLTDDLLISISQKKHASLVTTDYNLNKVAVAEGIVVLNVNELAQVLRPKALPGEIVRVKLIQKGEGHAQSVGYLDDGTMVIVENTTSRLKNTTVSATVERMIQTKAGKMIFARYK